MDLNEAQFEGLSARDWAERLYVLCRDLQGGDPDTLFLPDQIADELAPYFETKEHLND